MIPLPFSLSVFLKPVLVARKSCQHRTHLCDVSCALHPMERVVLWGKVRTVTDTWSLLRTGVPLLLVCSFLSAPEHCVIQGRV